MCRIKLYDGLRLGVGAQRSEHGTAVSCDCGSAVTARHEHESEASVEA